MPYAAWYDEHAKVFDIGPGQMLNWQLNAPHRVENLGSVNISMTVSYANDEIRRAEIVNLANGLLRHRFGYQPKSRSMRGPSYFAKAVMQKADARQRLGQARAQGAPRRSNSGSTPLNPARSSICRRRPEQIDWQ